MAGSHETQTVTSEDSSDAIPLMSSEKSCGKASSSYTHGSVGDISDDRKWQFRPPPRGLTPNEYVLCHR